MNAVTTMLLCRIGALLLMADASRVADTAWEKLPALPEPSGGLVCGAFDETLVVMCDGHPRRPAGEDRKQHRTNAVWRIQSEKLAP